MVQDGETSTWHSIAVPFPRVPSKIKRVALPFDSETMFLREGGRMFHERFAEWNFSGVRANACLSNYEQMPVSHPF